MRFSKRKLPVSPFKLVKELEQSQYWEKERIQNYQIQSINNLLKIAKEHIPYYRSNIEEGQYPQQQFSLVGEVLIDA